MPSNADSSNLVRVHATVHGRVQGVNFRHFTERYATEHNLTGWVRNRRDRTVETVAEGTGNQLDGFVKFLHEGSPYAMVTHVEVEWLEASSEFETFETLYSSD